MFVTGKSNPKTLEKSHTQTFTLSGSLSFIPSLCSPPTSPIHVKPLIQITTNLSPRSLSAGIKRVYQNAWLDIHIIIN